MNLDEHTPSLSAYDFDTPPPRRGTASMKWDTCGDDDILPLWVADMDFTAAPCIVAALRQRVAHGVFGYTLVPASYYDATIRWFAHRHAFAIDKEWIQPVPGVVPALSCVIKALTRRGDSVLFMAPAYNCFFSSVRNNGCKAELSPLRPVGDTYEIDFDDFERRAAREEVRLFVLCNPHNPVGRVWTAEELRRISEICRRHDVIVVSDEIHGEIVMPQHKYIPYPTVSATQGENITLLSPTKGFNLAGLQIANIICDNPSWRKKIDRAINDNEVCDLNSFGIVALQAAYNEGEEWLNAVNAYIYRNYLLLRSFLAAEVPSLRVCRLEGTYLAWVDVSALSMTAEALCDRLLHEGRVWVNGGKMYGDPCPQQHIRLNLACPQARLMDALHRIAGVVTNIIQGK